MRAAIRTKLRYGRRVSIDALIVGEAMRAFTRRAGTGLIQDRDAHSFAPLR
jgi:hypothetical protein